MCDAKSFGLAKHFFILLIWWIICCRRLHKKMFLENLIQLFRYTWERFKKWSFKFPYKQLIIWGGDDWYPGEVALKFVAQIFVKQLRWLHHNCGHNFCQHFVLKIFFADATFNFKEDRLCFMRISRWLSSPAMVESLGWLFASKRMLMNSCFKNILEKKLFVLLL